MSIIDSLADIPMPFAIQTALRACATLDVLLCEQDWLRCYDYQPNWSEDVVMAKYDNGGGDHLWALFHGNDAIIKGFDHESPVSPYAREDESIWPGMYRGVPTELEELLLDSAVERAHVTFCIWHQNEKWHCGPVQFEKEDEDDGSDFLLDMIHLSPEAFCRWAQDYYECELDRDAVGAVYGGKLDEEIVARINPDRDAKAALKEVGQS